MRLINADELIWRLGFENTQMEREENVGEIVTLEMIDDIPTAYDLDGVLEQLEENQEIKFHFNGAKTEQMIKLSKAIEIVKGGAK